MPPVVGVHEGVAALPGVGHRFEEGHALEHLAARLQAMGDGVMRPGIAAVDRERGARDLLGLVEAIALLEAEGIHRVDVAVVRVGGEQALADAQQGLGIAAVEGMELAELAGQKVARPFGRHVLVDLQAAVGVAVDPGRGRGEPGLLAGVGVRGKRLGAGEILARRLAAFVGVHRQHEVGRHHRQERAACLLVGGGDELGQPVAEGEPFVAQEIQGGDRLRTGVAHLQPLTVPRHFRPRLPLSNLRMPWQVGQKRQGRKHEDAGISWPGRAPGRRFRNPVARRRFPSGPSVSSCPMRRADRPTPPPASSPRSSPLCSASR